MAIFTKDFFQQVVQSRKGSYRSVSEFVNEARNFSRTNASTSIFLSHCHTDKRLIEQVVTFFRTFRASVYVDWMDDGMPVTTNGTTASIIKKKIAENNKFILVATDDAINSKWCNWELGLGDVFKSNNGNICLLPLAETRSSWKGNEYLQIYPRIEAVSSGPGTFYDNIYKVIDPNGKEFWLDDWLSN